MDEENNTIQNNLVLEPQFSSESLEKFPDCNLVLWRNVFKDECAKSLKEEVSNLPFSYSINDLHSMSQTEDFSKLVDLPKLCGQFLHFMHTSTLLSVLRESFGLEDKVSGITMTASLYKQNDYLLCHDDQVGDRTVAFVYYLTENWDSSDGGQLQFFNYDECKKEPVIDSFKKVLVPEFNSMVLFLVNDSSFHEVEQVFGTKQRISINGWFHTKSRNSDYAKSSIVSSSEPQKLFQKTPLFTFEQPLSDLLCKDILSPEYRVSVTRAEMSKVIQCNSRIFAHEFLETSFFEEVANELSKCTSWSLKGPPFRRKYETLEINSGDYGIVVQDSHSNKLNVLLNFLRSSSWLRFLCSLTNAELTVLKDTLVPPTCMMEVQKWRKGYYTVLAAHDIMQNQSSIDISLFFNVDKSATHQDKADKGNGSIVHIIKDEASLGKTWIGFMKVVKRVSAISRCKYYIDEISKMMTTSNKKKWNQTRIWIMKVFKKRIPVTSSLLYMRNIYKKMILSFKNRGMEKTQYLEFDTERILQIVDYKMTRIKDYRKTRRTEVEFVTPSENSFLLTLNSEDTNQYTSYLLKNHRDDSDIMFHCVNVTYLRTGKDVSDSD